MKKFKIANHLTGVLCFGESKAAMIENIHNWTTGWQFSQGEAPSSGYRKEYQLKDQTFHILEEETTYLYLENAETGIKFYLGFGEYAVVCLQKIPVDS